MLTPKEKAQVETLAFDAMVDVLALEKHMDGLCEGSGYRWSLPGTLPASRSAYDQLGLYQRGRVPVSGRPGDGPIRTPSGKKLYPRHMLRPRHGNKKGVVTYCDGFKVLSKHQAPDPKLASLQPELRGEGRALDHGMRRLSDNRFFYHDQAPEKAQELFREAIRFLKARGWEWGLELWGWDENHSQKP